MIDYFRTLDHLRSIVVRNRECFVKIGVIEETGVRILLRSDGCESSPEVATEAFLPTVPRPPQEAGTMWILRRVPPHVPKTLMYLLNSTPEVLRLRWRDPYYNGSPCMFTYTSRRLIEDRQTPLLS